jgi:flagella basal body P-ring formation protein FlgA
MRGIFTASLVFVAVCLSARTSTAEAPSISPNLIRVQGRGEAVVTEGHIRLGDIAQIDSPNVRDDEAIIHLKRIAVGTSPKAGETMLLDGAKVLERLRDEGVRLDSLRYTLPRNISVTRAFREVKVEELERALQAFITKGDKQLDVKQIVVDKPVKVPTDSLGLEVVALQTTKPGHIGVDYKSVAGSEEVRFQMKALADEWRMMPVAARPLAKGSLVAGNDIQLARMNATALAKDSIENLADVIGRSLTKDVGQGEIFKASSVVIPPVVNAGSRVTVLFRLNRLEVTAAGTALENGGLGQDIRVRNDSSKKVVIGRVVEPGLVTVGDR